MIIILGSAYGLPWVMLLYAIDGLHKKNQDSLDTFIFRTAVLSNSMTSVRILLLWILGC